MEDPFSRGLAFEIGDLFRKSSFFLDAHTDSIFPSLDTNVPSLKPIQHDTGAHFDLTPDLPDLPTLEENLQPHEEVIEEVPKQDTPPGLDDQLPDTDVWDLDLDYASEELPKFCTWEVFGKHDVPHTAHTAFLSEAGPAAFDASMRILEKSIGVLPQDYVLRCLSSLASGRSSSLFQWNAKTAEFDTILEGATLSGASLKCTNSAIDLIKEAGQTVAFLRDFSVPSYGTRKDCSALLALRSCVSDILDAVDEFISPRLSTIRSVAQLQQLLARPQLLLGFVKVLIERAKTLKTDEDVISSVSDQIHQDVQKFPPFSAIFRALLARVSLPWLEELSVDLGFRVSLTRSDQEQQSTDLARGASRAQLAFLNDSDVDLIRETKAAVAILRQQYPAHPLLKEHQTASDAVRCHSLPGQNHSHSAAQQYERDSIAAISNIPGAAAQVPAADESTLQHDETVASLWQDGDFSELYIPDLESTMPFADVAQPVLELHAQVEAALQNNDDIYRDATLNLESDLFLSPIDHIRPLIHVQHRLVNGVLLRQLLRTHHLQQHLQPQHSFQLLGNGNFVSRLATALFSKEVQSAERRRGVLPTAETMGLRVGATKDQRWPPASSELQLTLMGLLSEETSTFSRVQQNLSFAIRELPEEEIDRVLDPHSIYALDFLRLQYTATPPLNTILTKEVLEQYDTIFRYLLKLHRVMHAVLEIPRKQHASVHPDRSKPQPARLLNFLQDSHSLLTTLLSHAMDIAISSPWRTFMSTLSSLERDLKAEDAAGEIGIKARLGIEDLRKLHEKCLDRMRTRLFLKRKQAKLTELVEEVLSEILKITSSFNISSTSEDENGDDWEKYAAYSEAVARLLESLRGAGNKPLKFEGPTEPEDLDVLRLLTARLEVGREQTRNEAVEK